MNYAEALPVGCRGRIDDKTLDLALPAHWKAYVTWKLGIKLTLAVWSSFLLVSL